MPFHIPVDALIHRCSADERCIPPEFVANLSKNQKALYESLCPHLRVIVAKMGIQISNMDEGHRMKQMIQIIEVKDLHAVLPLVQRGLAEVLGVSTWSVSKFAKAIVKMDRWPARQYSGPAKLAGDLDEKLRDAHRAGAFVTTHDAATRLFQHLQRYSGMHICGAIERFRIVDQGIRDLNERNGGPRRTSSEDLQVINPSTS